MESGYWIEVVFITFGSATALYGSAALPFVIPSEAEESAVSASQYQMPTGETVLFIPSVAEGSAVPRTIPGNVFRLSAA